MHRSSCWPGVLLVIAVGCGARNGLYDSSGAQQEDDLVCSEEPAPRVADCARATPAALPIARLTSVDGDGSHTPDLATDSESLYYVSEGRVFSLPMSGGTPSALTPPGSAGGQLRVADGFVYWRHNDVVQRVATSGGQVEPLVKLAPAAAWAVAGDAILAAGEYPQPSPLYRTSLTTGETRELLAEDPDQFIQHIGVVGDRALVALSDSLVSVSLTRGDAQLLVTSKISAGGPPIVDSAHIYFGVFDVEGGTRGVYRIARNRPSPPELFLTGFPVAMALDGDALFANVVPGVNVGEDDSVGELVRAPLDGAHPERLAFTDARGTAAYVTYGSPALVVTACDVYFIEVCSDLHVGEYRLVTLAKQSDD